MTALILITGTKETYNKIRNTGQKNETNKNSNTTFIVLEKWVSADFLRRICNLKMKNK